MVKCNKQWLYPARMLSLQKMKRFEPSVDGAKTNVERNVPLCVWEEKLPYFSANLVSSSEWAASKCLNFFSFTCMPVA